MKGELLMDETTKFVIERMDAGFKEVRGDVKELELRLMNQIQEIQGFKNKVFGMASVMSVVVSGVASFIFRKIF